MAVVIGAALVVGLILGLTGSGGSILTVPALVYLLGHDGKVAIAESLAIVGSIAVTSVLPSARSGLVNWRSVIYFGIPGMAGTYLGAWLSQFVGAAVQLTLFAVVMLLAAALMFRKNARAAADAPAGQETDSLGASPSGGEAFWLIGLEGITVGVITGLVGVGGGFLIVPALVVFGKLPMRVAISTSLAVIAMNSFSGFFKYLNMLQTLGGTIDWATVGIFILVGILGSWAGQAAALRLNQRVLRTGFACFLVIMGLFVLGKEMPKLWSPSRAAAQHPVSSERPVDHLPLQLGGAQLPARPNSHLGVAI